MPEYIEREALIEKILSISVTVMGVRSGKTLFYEALKSYREAVLKIIKKAPTADVVEVRHGEWQSLDRDHFSCTQCGHIFALGSTATIYNVKQQWQYCPKCGAKMDGKEVANSG